MKKLSFLLLLTSIFLHGQSQIPNDYFASPLGIDLILSGNFGELRSNHFHSGLDIKTQQRIGLPIYASADGFVSRANVSHYGYGKALYIQHPNGYTTVYAHLNQFAGEIQAYIKDQQYQKESYEIELFPEKNRLEVKKGDLIAYSGNTGSSGGPHLHFEIRDSSQRPMNPMLFGFDIPDSKPPIINSLFAYPIGEDAHVNQSQHRTKLRLIKVSSGIYKTEDLRAYGDIGFGVSSEDQLDGALNKNGVYNITTKLNATKKFEVRFDKFSFSETRYLNRYIDFGYFQTDRSRIQKLFRQSNNPLSVIVDEYNNGILNIKDSLDYSYVIDVIDFKGNTSSIIVPIKGQKAPILNPRTLNTTYEFVRSDHATKLTKGKFSIYIPANSLYEDAYLDITAQGDNLTLHNKEVPLHKNVTITADISHYKPEDRDRLFIGKLNNRGIPRYVSTTRKEDKLTASTRELGDYTIAYDSVPPKITPVNFSAGQWISDQKTLRVKISDDLSGISSYRATINGKFILMEYEYKNNTLTYDFNDGVNDSSENNLKLIVIDNVGNSATFEAQFFRKQP